MSQDKDNKESSLDQQKQDNQKPTVVVVGGAGHIGKHVVEEFLNHLDDFKVINVLEREASDCTRSFESRGAKIIVADVMDHHNVVALFDHHKFDIVVSTLNGEALHHGQINLLKACQSAKHRVSHFFPAEYGVDLSEGTKEEALFEGKITVARMLEDTTIPYTRVMAGCYPELVFGTDWLGMNLASGKIDVPGDGNVKACYTTIPDVARYIVQCALHPEISKNRIIRVSGDCATVNEAVAMYEKASGKKVKVNFVPLDDLRSRIHHITHSWDKMADQLKYTIVSGDACFENHRLDNSNFPAVKPLTLSAFFHAGLKTNPNQPPNENYNPNVADNGSINYSLHA